MELVIAEKPSVAYALARVLGAGTKHDGYLSGDKYLVSWCFGHLVGLCDADEYNPNLKKWDFESLPIIPEEWKLKVYPNGREQFKTLQKLLNHHNVSEIVNACDAGREGELIFRFVYEMSGCCKPFKRLWISSMEDGAIREGFRELKDGHEYDLLYQSALCRIRADWLVGINATRLFTSLYKRPLHVGRVQSPTLALLVEREKQIRDFVKEPYYTIALTHTKVKAESGRLERKSAENFIKLNQGADARVTSVERKNQKINPPKLFDLTALQRTANKLYGFTAQETLNSLQALYEKRLVTYPRTDSRYVTSDMIDTIVELIPAVRDRLELDKNDCANYEIIINDDKVSDHHAVIPTKEIASLSVKLSEKENKILTLVCIRFLEAVAEPCIAENTEFVIISGNMEFHAKSSIVLSNGWTALEEKLKEYFRISYTEDGADSVKQDNQIFDIYEGQALDSCQFKLQSHMTAPPKRYTEAALLSAMENAGKKETDPDTEKKGLGTPATRAGIIEKLLKTETVVRKGKTLVPTEKGMRLIDVLPQDIKSPSMTAEWENSLHQIMKGELSGSIFMDRIKAYVKDFVLEQRKVVSVSEITKMTAAVNNKEIIGTCPRCGAVVYEQKKSYSCCGSECDFVMWKDDYFFKRKQKKFTKTIAKAFLKNGEAKVKGLYSEDKDNKYDAIVVLNDTGGRVGYKLKF